MKTIALLPKLRSNIQISQSLIGTSHLQITQNTLPLMECTLFQKESLFTLVRLHGIYKHVIYKQCSYKKAPRPKWPGRFFIS
jgi:hypothetical protein